MKKPRVYYLQNRAIHRARAQLENSGTLNPWSSLDEIRGMAARINLGIKSISRLSLAQRRTLIEQLKILGAEVRNPHIYPSDLEAERRTSGDRAPRKILLFSEPKETQLRMLDTLAARVAWRELDGYLRFCHKLLKAPRPRNSREVTKLRLALESLLSQQSSHAQTSPPSAPFDAPPA